MNVEFAASKDYTPRRGASAQIDLIQFGAPGDPEKIVGGQRFTVDLSKLVLVKADDQWRYWDTGTNPAGAWTSSDYDNSKWKLGTAPLGAGGNPATTMSLPADRRNVTTYFRRTFDVADPSFYKNALLRLMRADGAIVYLNGSEIYRVNLPTRAVSASTTATRQVTGLERDVFFPVKIDPAKLKRGQNVLAAEIHANSPQRAGINSTWSCSQTSFAGPGFPPDIAFAVPPDAAAFQTGENVPVKFEALSGDAKIASVSLYAEMDAS